MATEVIYFEMGLYRAALPVRLRYADVHFWFDLEAVPGRTRCGLTSYAARLLDDVFRLDWAVQAGEDLGEAAPLGTIESHKACSELYAPMAGKLAAINEDVVAEPGRIQRDPYVAWLLEFEGAPGESMDAEQYRAFLAEGWEETQRLLKGQL
ncbi:MAG: glycine cleavage system protein H [Planctomycetes bacterium]|nr:glycine cleavage system protein H [Planctomycetota bacterium]